jgi:iron complex outermembrane receptor protein
MIRRRTTWVGLLLGLWPLLGAAQLDTTGIRLSPVLVRAVAPERFMAGLYVQRTDSALLSAYRFQTLADLLALQAPVQFKSYGPGQLTTIGLRGTSANHTAVLWNGVNINQPTLGQTDFSTLPAGGFDQVLLQYGSAASCVGTDAVGGSILLGNGPQFGQSGFAATVGHRVASFHTYQTQAGLRWNGSLGKGWQLATRTHLYGGTFRNRPAYREREGYPIDISETAQRGLMQDLYLRKNSHQQLSLNIWLSDNKLTLAPDDSISREVTQTRAYRFLATYTVDTWLLRAGFIRDGLDYGKGSGFETNPSRSLTDRFISHIEREFTRQFGSVGRQLTLRAGGEWVHYRALVDGYGPGLLREDRADLFALFRYQHNARLVIGLNLRQAFVTRFDPPLTPSLGIDYRLVDRRDWRLEGRANVARSYRVPTLNERYWLRLGNPNIRPENGFAQELGLTWTRLSANGQPPVATLSLTAFRNRVRDWTYWNPDQDYRVENLQQVLAQGLEAQGRLTATLDRWRLGAFGQYAYTHSVQERVYAPSALAVIGKQLIYLPLHTASANIFVQYKTHRLTLLWQGVDRRSYTFDGSRYLPGYQTMGLIAETGMQLGSWRGRLVGQVDNLFDALVLTVKRNAAPGRTVSLSLLLTLN